MSNNRSDLLTLAESLVNGDRNVQYGDPRSDFLRTARLWETYLNGAHERHVQDEYTADSIIIEPHDVAILMLLLKISRLAWSPDKQDTWADIAGYAACGWDCVAENGEGDRPAVNIDYLDAFYQALQEDEEAPEEVDQDDVSLSEEEVDEALEFLRNRFLNTSIFRNVGR